MHTCTECDREFSNFDTPGKCPVCGVWMKIRCGSCGRESSAKKCIDNRSKCPKCDARVKVPGRESKLIYLTGMIAIAGFLLWLLMRIQQYFESVSSGS